MALSFCTRWIVISMVIISVTLTVTRTSDFPDFSIFWEGEDETAFKKCLKEPLICHSKPECEGNNPKYDELRACSSRVHQNYKDCPEEMIKAKTLISDYYSGYNEVKAVFCANETIREELKNFMDDDHCWKAFIVCLAPLEMFQQNSLKQDLEYCKTMRTFLETKCMDDQQTKCFEDYTAFWEKYFGKILCQGEDDSSAAIPSLHIASLVLFTFVLLVFQRH